ncbi:uncharacterized protein LOC118350662 [Canis lupus dingo]|uniref:uncharacterized protein LOC118350662 n=1 Tax=Canis lupus dingo TaxID=286419 RepID=UPI0020C3A513|nr:uncharacterized protein LOC118350662 [Canis lupus dingo]
MASAVLDVHRPSRCTAGGALPPQQAVARARDTRRLGSTPQRGLRPRGRSATTHRATPRRTCGERALTCRAPTSGSRPDVRSRALPDFRWRPCRDARAGLGPGAEPPPRQPALFLVCGRAATGAEGRGRRPKSPLRQAHPVSSAGSRGAGRGSRVPLPRGGHVLPVTSVCTQAQRKFRAHITSTSDTGDRYTEFCVYRILLRIASSQQNMLLRFGCS